MKVLFLNVTYPPAPGAQHVSANKNDMYARVNNVSNPTKAPATTHAMFRSSSKKVRYLESNMILVESIYVKQPNIGLIDICKAT